MPDRQERLQLQQRFSHMISAAEADESGVPSNLSEILEVAKELGARTEVTKKADGSIRTCMWVCQNNYACDPDSPPPNCRCREICW